MGIINKIKNLFKKDKNPIVINTDVPTANNLSVNELDCSNVEVVDLHEANSNRTPKPVSLLQKRIPRLSEKQILRNHRIAKVMFCFNIDDKKAREYLKIKQIEERTKKIRIKKKQLKRIQKLFVRG